MKSKNACSQQQMLATKANIIEAMGNGFILVDMDGIVEDVNQVIEEIIGYEKSELIGKDIEYLAQKFIKPEEAELEDVPTKETVGQIHPLRILVIDDEAKLRQLMKDILETDGHTVVLADDGLTGVDTFHTAKQQDEPFDLVITDLGMPEMDGHQVTHAIKRESPSTPIILLTGWGNRMNAENNTSTEVDAVLGKPPEIEKLRRTLAAVL